MEANQPSAQDLQETALPQRLAATAMLAYGIWLALKALFHIGISVVAIRNEIPLYGYVGFAIFVLLNSGGAILLWWKCDTIAAWCFRRHDERQAKTGGIMLLEAALPVLGVLILAATFMTLASLISYLLWIRDHSGNELVENILKSRPPSFEIPLMVVYNILMAIIGLVLMRFGTAFAKRIYRFNAASQEQHSGRSTP